MELVITIIIVLVGVAGVTATVVSFIKQPYQAKGADAAGDAQSLKRQQQEALYHAHEALQQFERAALEICQREENLLYLLAESPQKNEDFRRILYQHQNILHSKMETLQQQEKELQRLIDVSQP